MRNTNNEIEKSVQLRGINGGTLRQLAKGADFTGNVTRHTSGSYGAVQRQQRLSAGQLSHIRGEREESPARGGGQITKKRRRAREGGD